METEQNMEKTLIILKPDTVDRRLVGTILSRFESKGLQMIAMKMAVISPETAARHYSEHEGKHFRSDEAKYLRVCPIQRAVASDLRPLRPAGLHNYCNFPASLRLLRVRARSYDRVSSNGKNRLL